MKLDLIYTITSDQLRLPGVQYKPSAHSDTCVLIIHGMSGNILENYWADILGRELAKNNITSIYSHNRGYGILNDIRVMNKIKSDNSFESRRIGVTYERFEESLLDIESWISTVSQMGYKKIVLLGHSLGANKVVHYMFKKHPKLVKGVILASPPDMVANLKIPHSNWRELLSQAKKLVESGSGHEILPFRLWDSYQLCAQVYIDMFTDHGPADNLPIQRNPDEFPELASIHIPILSLMGEFDDIVVRSLAEDQEVLQQKASSCPSFIHATIPGASHTYDNRESELSEVIINWLKSQNL